MKTELHECEVYYDNEHGEACTIKLRTNMNDGELYAAAHNWLYRTDKFTDNSLIAYINSKGLHRAAKSRL